MRKKAMLAKILLISMLLGAMGCTEKADETFGQEPDLVVYTLLPREVYQPIVREFESRNEVCVEVCELQEEEIIEQLRMNRENFHGDIVLGLPKSTVEKNEQLFPEREEFSASSYVIIYNTNIVLHKEAPEDFGSLLEERWKGKLGFPNPATSAVSQGILAFLQSVSYTEEQLNAFYDNVQNQYADSMEEAAQGVCTGRYAAGIVTEGKAQALMAEGEDIAYVHLDQKDCIIANMAVTTLKKGSGNVARSFLEFLVSDDVQKYMKQYLKYQPAENGKGGES